MQQRSNAGTIFKWVVDDVIAKVKPEFVQEGVEESVLDDLRQAWEAKLTAQGLIGAGNDPIPAGRPSQGMGMAQPGMLGMAGMVPRPGLPPHMYQGLPGLAAGAAPLQHLTPQQVAQQMLLHHMQQAAGARAKAEAAAGVATGPMRPAMPIAAPVAAPVVGAKRKEPEGGRSVPQHDGAADADAIAGPSGSAAACSFSGPLTTGAQAGRLKQSAGATVAGSGVRIMPGSSSVPQHDGPGDGDGDDDGEDDEEEDVAPPAQAQGGKDSKEGKGGGAGTSGSKEPAGDEELSSDSEADEEEEGDISNFLCCQFEKVNRVKNKWKINIRDGVFRINGQDYVFKKGTGEWAWT